VLIGPPVLDGSVLQARHTQPVAIGRDAFAEILDDSESRTPAVAEVIHRVNEA
jgi:hypothetical protein